MFFAPIFKKSQKNLHFGCLGCHLEVVGRFLGAVWHLEVPTQDPSRARANTLYTQTPDQPHKRSVLVNRTVGQFFGEDLLVYINELASVN